MVASAERAHAWLIITIQIMKDCRTVGQQGTSACELLNYASNYELQFQQFSRMD
jgi:uncharacterized protein YbgA (DUF1722 family)